MIYELRISKKLQKQHQCYSQRKTTSLLIITTMLLKTKKISQHPWNRWSQKYSSIHSQTMACKLQIISFLTYDRSGILIFSFSLFCKSCSYPVLLIFIFTFDNADTCQHPTQCTTVDIRLLLQNLQGSRFHWNSPVGFCCWTLHPLSENKKSNSLVVQHLYLQLCDSSSFKVSRSF